ncbi:MAG: endonuclease III domain-containing protein [Spirochaetota bacterium]
MPDLFNNWNLLLEPLFSLYRGRRHPLAYENRYQLLVMVVLSAQDSDRHINECAPALFRAYPSMTDLAGASPQDLLRFIGSVANCANKAAWLCDTAKMLGCDDKIPRTIAELTGLPGIGRKSANVIIRESGGEAEGIIVDLHVMRVAPRLGIAAGKTPEKIERELMDMISPEKWNDAGMALSFLGREICRPSHPQCPACVMKDICPCRIRVCQKSGSASFS